MNLPLGARPTLLRHTFVIVAGELDFSGLTIAALLGLRRQRGYP
jgi:hypothetical protein